MASRFGGLTTWDLNQSDGLHLTPGIIAFRLPCSLTTWQLQQTLHQLTDKEVNVCCIVSAWQSQQTYRRTRLQAKQASGHLGFRRTGFRQTRLQAKQASGDLGFRRTRLQENQASGELGYRRTRLQANQASGELSFRRTKLQANQATGELSRCHSKIHRLYISVKNENLAVAPLSTFPC